MESEVAVTIRLGEPDDIPVQSPGPTADRFVFGCRSHFSKACMKSSKNKGSFLLQCNAQEFFLSFAFLGGGSTF